MSNQKLFEALQDFRFSKFSNGVNLGNLQRNKPLVLQEDIADFPSYGFLPKGSVVAIYSKQFRPVILNTIDDKFSRNAEVAEVLYDTSRSVLPDFVDGRSLVSLTSEQVMDIKTKTHPLADMSFGDPKIKRKEIFLNRYKENFIEFNELLLCPIEVGPNGDTSKIRYVISLHTTHHKVIMFAFIDNKWKRFKILGIKNSKDGIFSINHSIKKYNKEILKIDEPLDTKVDLHYEACKIAFQMKKNIIVEKSSIFKK